MRRSVRCLMVRTGLGTKWYEEWVWETLTVIQKVSHPPVSPKKGFFAGATATSWPMMMPVGMCPGVLC